MFYTPTYNWGEPPSKKSCTSICDQASFRPWHLSLRGMRFQDSHHWGTMGGGRMLEMWEGMWEHIDVCGIHTYIHTCMHAHIHAHTQLILSLTASWPCKNHRLTSAMDCVPQPSWPTQEELAPWITLHPPPTNSREIPSYPATLRTIITPP